MPGFGEIDTSFQGFSRSHCRREGLAAASQEAQ